MTRAEIAARYDSIVAFAELGEFIDMPVKRYSSGMYVRLGFSVAVHTEPDVLLVDEVLAVGDVGFQAKCMDRMLAFRDEGVTIIFVSHNLAAVAQMCSRVLWLEHGRAMMSGEALEVLGAYQHAQDQRLRDMQRVEEVRARDLGTGEVVIERITMHREDGSPADAFEYRGHLLMRIHYRAIHEVRRPYFVVRVTHQAGTLFTASMTLDESCPEMVQGRGVIEVLFRELPLLPGVYHVVGQILRDVSTSYFSPRQLASFTVDTALSTYGYHGRIGQGSSRNVAPVVVPYEWRFPDQVPNAQPGDPDGAHA
jgi:ABC-2 type transport system ATP-binding protein